MKSISSARTSGRTKRRKKRVSKYPWYAKYIFAAARKAWRWSPERRAVIKKSTATDNPDYRRCTDCLDNKWHHKDDTHVDHIEPVIDAVTGFTTWDNYFLRLFCPAENLAVLCKSCHLIKSKGEAGLRKQSRSERSEI